MHTHKVTIHRTDGAERSTLYECSEWHKKAAQQLRERVAEVHFNCVGHAELVAAIARHERFAKALQTHLLAFPGSADVGPGSKVKRHISKKTRKSK